jgi:hypothetical protein
MLDFFRSLTKLNFTSDNYIICRKSKVLHGYIVKRLIKPNDSLI